MVALGPHHLPPSPPGRHCSLRPHTRARCPPVSSSMSSCVLLNVLLCLFMFSYYVVICSPPVPFTITSYLMHSKMFFCVFLDVLLYHHVFLCLLGPSSCSFICMFPSCVFLYPSRSPTASPLNVPLSPCYNPVFSCALLHVVILCPCFYQTFQVINISHKHVYIVSAFNTYFLFYY